MTVQQLFDLTIGLMGLNSTNASTYLETIYPQVNILLGQCFRLENNLRTSLGLTVLTDIPEVVALSDVLTYQDRVLRTVMPWGLAQLMVLTDDDYVKAGFFGARYADEFALLLKALPTDVTDYFATAEDET